MATDTTGQYIVAIYRLCQSEPWARTGQIAQALNVRLSSVSEMLRRLDESGYIVRKNRIGARLTEKGLTIALNRLRKQRLVERLLVDFVGYRLDELHKEACPIACALSDALVERLDDALGNPEFDPHGNPIPRSDGTVVATSYCPLCNISEGESAIVRQICDSNAAKVGYLCDLALVPGSEVTLLELTSIQGLMTILVNGRKRIITVDLARDIQIETV